MSSETTKVIVGVESTTVVIAAEVGPRGPSGFSDGADLRPLQYRHVQTVASSTWTIDHNLGFRPGGITVVDTAGNQWICGDITHPSDNRTILAWSAPFSGTAYLS